MSFYFCESFIGLFALKQPHRSFQNMLRGGQSFLVRSFFSRFRIMEAVRHECELYTVCFSHRELLHSQMMKFPVLYIVRAVISVAISRITRQVTVVYDTIWVENYTFLCMDILVPFISTRQRRSLSTISFPKPISCPSERLDVISIVHFVKTGIFRRQ